MGGREEVGGFQDSLKLEYFSDMHIKEGREVVWEVVGGFQEAAARGS